jgi:WD40 repeat protein/tetratricopeptide (TPR) repeat protein
MSDQPPAESGVTVAYTPPPTVTVPPRDTAPDGPPGPPTMPAAAVTVSLGDAALIPGYEILAELGRGGMGVVYKARQVALNRLVALKMILAGPHAAGQALTRFKAEAEVIAKLHHANIVQIYDIGEHDGRPYFSLELVEGGSLAQRLAGHPQPPDAAAGLVEVLARAVHLAHEAGIVHRDLKPANILLQTDARPSAPPGSARSVSRSAAPAVTAFGTPKITDFGLAKNLSGTQLGQTHTGSIMGTPSYMSPEQAAGDVKEIGPPTDIYALGAILYELLTGRPPFRADTPLNTIMEVVRGDPVPPRRLQRKVPRDLETVCLKCLEKPPAKRYPSALHLADDLHRYLEGLPITARPAGPGERLVKWARRRPTLAALVATVVLAGATLVAGGVWAYAAVTRRAAEAEAARAEAQAQVELNRQRLVRLYVADGARQLDTGDLYGALLWFAEGLRHDTGPDTREAMHRRRLAAVLAQTPLLQHVWVHEGAVPVAAYRPDGAWIVTAGADGLARIWDTASGRAVGPPLEHGGPIGFAEFTADGRRVLTGGPDGFAHLWDLTTGQRLKTLGVGAAFAAGRVHPDGRRAVLAARAGGVRIWDMVAGQPVSPILPNAHPTGLAFSPDGALLLAAGDDGLVKLWDMATYAPALQPLKHAAAVTAAAFSPDGRLVATATADGTAQVWAARTGEPTLPRPLRHRGAVNAVAFSPDGKWLATGGDDKAAQVWELATGVRVAPSLMHGSPVTSVAFSPDGRWVVTGSGDNTARAWDAATGQSVSPVLRHNGTPLSVTFSPDGRSVLTGGADGLVRVWTFRAAPPAPAAAQAAPPLAATGTVTSPDGRLVVTFGGDPFARLRRAGDREPVGAPLRHDGPVTAAAFSPDGRWVVTAGSEGVVQMWDTAAGTPRWQQPPRHASRVYSVAVSPDGRRVATGSDDDSAYLLDAATGRLLAPPIRHNGDVVHVAFSATGEALFTASLDGTSRVWDAATAEPLTPPLPPWDGKPWRDDAVSDSRPVADLLALAQVLSVSRIDDAGSRVQLTPAAVRDQWAKLRAAYPTDFVPAGESASTWHKAQAEAAEAAGQWFAAAWQLGRWAVLEPDRADVRRRQARAFAEQGAWESAAASATQAIKLNPGDWEAWQRRGLASGELKRWDQSVADLAQAYALSQEPERRHALVALLPLAAGDRDGYRRVCSELLAKAGDSPDAATALWVAWACVLAPDAVADPQAVVRLAETAASARPRHAAALTTLGAALFRAGQADKAAERLREATALDGAASAAWLFLALAEQRRGQPAAAGQALAKAIRPDGPPAPRTWQQQEELRVWRAEVEPLVRKAAPTP